MAKQVSKEAVEEKAVVSVEMTEAQKDKFTAMMAEEEKKKEAPKKEKIEIDLRFGHNVNNKAYGPGRVICDADIGYAMVERDYAALQARLRVHESSNHMIEILTSGQRIVRKIEST